MQEYKDIKHLIVSQKEENGTMFCEFQDPSSQQIIRSEAKMKYKSSKRREVEHIAHSSAFYAMRIELMNALTKTIGTGYFGHAVRRMVYAMLPDSPSASPKGKAYNDHERKVAVVAAFKKVKNQFNQDRRQGTWEMKREESTFDTVIKQAPITKVYDQEILMRMLIELARLDGISAEEHLFLQSFTSDMISFNELLNKPNISHIEFEETTPAVRETMYLLAWVIALIDKKLTYSEKNKLTDYASMLNISYQRTQDLIKYAKHHIIGVAMKNELGKGAILQIAQDIELSNEEAERAMVQYRKRNY
ncbi:MAG: hypothetical protein ACPG5B_04765 [Chitinophagales bacterium]